MPVLADVQPSSQQLSSLCCATPSHVCTEDQCISFDVCKTGENTNSPPCSSPSQRCSGHPKELSTVPLGNPEATSVFDTALDHPAWPSSANCSLDGEADINAAEKVEKISNCLLEVDESQPSIHRNLVDDEVVKTRRPQRKRAKSTTIGRFKVSREYLTSSSTTPGGGSRNLSDYAQSQKGSSRDMGSEIKEKKEEWLRMLDFSMTRYASLPSSSQDFDYLEHSSNGAAETRMDVPDLGSGPRSNNTSRTTSQAKTAPVAIPKPFSKRIYTSVDSSWTADENALNLGSVDSMDFQVSNNSYDEFGSTSSSITLSTYFSAHSTSPVKTLIDFDEVVASRRSDWIPSRPASTSPAESISSSSLSPKRLSSSEFSESPESSWHAFDLNYHPPAHLMSEETQAPRLNETAQFVHGSGKSPDLYFHHTEMQPKNDFRVANANAALPSFVSSRPSSQWLGARCEETTDLPLWSPSPLTLSQCLTSRSNSISSSTVVVMPTEISAATAATTESSRPAMTSSLAQALAKLTSSAAIASIEDDSPVETEMPYEGPTSQPKLRSVRRRVPVITRVPEELHPEFAAMLEGTTPSSGAWFGQHFQDQIIDCGDSPHFDKEGIW